MNLCDIEIPEFGEFEHQIADEIRVYAVNTYGSQWMLTKDYAAIVREFWSNKIGQW